MNANHSHSVLLLPLLANAAALHMIFLLFAFPGEATADHGGMVIWWLCITAAHFILSRYMRKPRELRSIVLLAAAFVVLQFALTFFLTEGYPTFITWSIMMFMWIGVYYRLVTNLQDGAKPEALTLSFEACSAALLITAALAPGGTLSPEILFHLLFGLLCTLIALAVLRSGHRRMDQDTSSRRKGGFLLAGMISALGLMAGLICALTTDTTAALVKRFTAWLLSVLQAIGRTVTAFFEWLFSLFSTDMEPQYGDAAAAPSLPQMTPEETATDNGIILYIIIGAVILGALFLLIKGWRTTKLQGQKTVVRKGRTGTRTQVGLWELFLRFLRRLSARIRFELQYLRSRNTAPGLFITLERTMKRKRKGRKPGETPEAFLSRIAEEYPLCAEDIAHLSSSLNRHYFGKGCDLSSEDAAAMAKRIKHAMHQGSDKAPD